VKKQLQFRKRLSKRSLTFSTEFWRYATMSEKVPKAPVPESIQKEYVTFRKDLFLEWIDEMVKILRGED